MILLDPQLIAFEAIVTEGTVHAAAIALHLTQTAITQRLRQLEQKMKTTLFIRSRRGMILTAEGEELHRYCQQVSDMGGVLLANIHGAGITSPMGIRISGPTSIMRSRIIPGCESVMKEFPNLLMSFLIDDDTNISQRLKSGEFDFVILRPEQVGAEMESKLLAAENYVLVCTSKWKHRKLVDVLKTERIIDFDPADQMTINYLKQFDLLDIVQAERHFVNNTESIARLFISGFGYGVLTKEFAEPYLKSGELHIMNQQKIYHNPAALAWYPRPEEPGYFSALVKAIN